MMMRTMIPVTRALTVLTAAAAVVALAAGCASKGSSGAGSGGSGGASATASPSPNDVEKTLAAALPEAMSGYGTLLFQKPAPGSKAYQVDGDAACQQFVNAITFDKDSYKPVGEVVAQYTQDQPKGAQGTAGITMARLSSAADAARVVSDVKSSAPECKSGFNHNNEKITLAAADVPAGTPGDSSAAVAETTSGAGSSGAKVWVLVVQKGSAVVQIAVNGTGSDANRAAIAKAMATTLVAH